MAVRFVVGRAGTGKTRHCLEAMQRAVRESPLAGPALILLVPEQASLQAERDLLAGIPGRASHRAGVLSFKRLAYRILASAGGGERQALTTVARAMILRLLLARHHAGLRYYRNMHGHGGFVERLGLTITELIEEGVEPEALPGDDWGGSEEPLPHGRGSEGPVAGARGSEEPLPDGRGSDKPLPDGRGSEEPLPHGRGSEEPLPDGRGSDQRRPGDAGCPDDPILSAKLHDLRLIYGAYLQALGVERVDPSQYLGIARERVERCDWLDGALVYADGFAGFSRQEALMLAALARRAEGVEITMLIDPGYAVESLGPGQRSCDLFARTARSIAQLAEVFAAEGVALAPPIELGGPSRRFRAPELVKLEQHLFGPIVGEEEPLPLPGHRCATSGASRSRLGRVQGRGSDNAYGRGSYKAFSHGRGAEEPLPHGRGSDNTHGRGSDQAPNIRLIEAGDRRTEVEVAVATVGELVQRGDKPLRFRDIAIVARDLEAYHTLIAAALADREIPYFIDRRRPTAHHPLVELLRGLAELAAGDLAIEPVRSLLRTGLLSLGDEAADELENYLLATGVAGRERWQTRDWEAPPRKRSGKDKDSVDPASIRRINDARRTFLRDLEPWLAATANSDPATGAAWADRIRTVMRHVSASTRIERWAREADDRGDLDLAETHRQILRDVDAVLDDLAGALGDEPIAVDDLVAILEAALAQLTLGLAPPMLDQVLVGSIERSRHPEIKAIILLGLNDGQFPAIPAEDSILNEDDRLWLEGCGLRVGTPRTQRVLDEAMLLYVACTRAAEHLTITYAATDEKGEPMQPSPFVDALRAACPGLQTETVAEPFGSRADWAIHTAGDLAAQLAFEFRSRPPVNEDQSDVRGRWNELYEAVRRDLELAPIVRPAVAALVYENASRIRSSPAADASYAWRGSVSQLETFAECPFRHFGQYRLRLKERELARLEAVDIGTIHHAILEDFIERQVGAGRSIAELDDPALMQELAASFEKLSEGVPLAGELCNARDRYILTRSRSELAQVLRQQRRVARSGQFRPRKTELGFGTGDDEKLPGLNISTPNGRPILLRGYVDRVDLAELADEMLGVVVDYKHTANKRLDLSEVYHGLSLQLLGYLLVLARHGETLVGRAIRPIGAFYVQLVESYKAVKHPDDVKPEEPAGGRIKPRGLLDAGRLDALETDRADGWSSTYSVYVKKDGGLGHIDHSDAAESADFAAMLEHTRTRIGELADRLIDGDVGVQPYRLGTFSPCSWCPLPAVCRVEPGVTPMRFLETLRRSDIFKRLRGDPTDGADA